MRLLLCDFLVPHPFNYAKIHAKGGGGLEHQEL
nr:MAG TPA: hypothetical protein [Caudoviricetes sp.]